MEIDLILNELSLRNPASDKRIACEWMSEFISSIKAIKAEGVKVQLRTQENFHTTILAPDYPIRRWLNDADEVERRFVKSLVTKAPFSNDIANLEIKEIEDGTGLSEFRYQGKLALGLGIAHLLDTIAISFPSEDCWDCHCLSIEYKRIDESEELINEIVDILHISHRCHVSKHSTWIKSHTRIEIIDGDDLWKKKEDIFPSLLFCECVQQQLTCLQYGNPVFKQVVKRLFELEEYCKIWTDGRLDYRNIPCKVSPESESRLQKFKDQLTFQCPDGIERVFSLHVRMTGAGAWRLYFSDEIGPGKIVIGYVGLKIT